MSHKEHTLKTRHPRTGFLAPLPTLLRARRSGAPSTVRSRLALLLSTAALALLLVPSLASAAEHLSLGTFGPANEPSFTSPMALAVDQPSGDVLVIDTANAEAGLGTLSRWHPDGTPADFSALATNVIGGLSFGFEGEVEVAVDNSGGPNDGNIYLATGSGGVKIYAEDGSSLGELTESSQGAFATPCGVTVDPSGNVYVGDYSGFIHKYEPAASPPVNADNTANFEFETNCNLAAGEGSSAGSLFASHYGLSVAKLNAQTGAEAYEIPSPAYALSVDPTSGHLFTSGGEEEPAITEYDVSGSSGATALTPSIPLASRGLGVAVDETNGNIYATRSGQGTVEVFNAGTLAVLPPAVSAVAPAEGPLGGGNEVQISGSALAGATKVEFGSVVVEAPFIEDSDSTIRLAAPPHPAGTVDVLVTTAGGSSPTAAAARYTYVPAPAVSALSPAKGPTAGGNQIEITGTDLTQATRVEFGTFVLEASEFAENTDTKIVLSAPQHAAGTVNVTVTTAGGASPDTAADDYIYIATPAVTALSPSKGPVAGGNQVEIGGLHLAEAEKVEFGAAVVDDSEFAENTDTKIVLSAPAHAPGTVNVRVTTLGGASLNFAADDYSFEGSKALTIARAGTGSGTVTCDGGACAPAYPFGATVTLTAAAAAGSSFAGFSGAACAATLLAEPATCIVTLAADTALTATFNANPAPPPPPPPVQCVVPKLKGKSLKAAKKALAAANCTTGKVTKPKKGKKSAALVVKSSQPGAGAALPVNSKVGLKLAPKPKKSD